MEYDEIIRMLESLSDPSAVEGMKRYKIAAGNIYDVSIPNLRKIAKEAGKDRQLAHKLWAADFRETKVLASMIDDPKMVTDEQIEAWVKDFDTWEVCDQCCMNLFEKTVFAYAKAVEWSSGMKSLSNVLGLS